MDTVIASPDAANLADAVMPDNNVQSVTEQFQGENNELQTQENTSQEQQTQTLQTQAPINYDVTLPEGYFLSDDMRAQFTKVAQECGLSNDAANKLINLHVQQMEAAAREQASGIADKAADFERLSRQDSEIGGAHFETSLKTAKAALNQFGTAALADVLNQSGLGNHPEMIRLFARIGKAMGEGHYAGSKETVTERPRTRAEIMYGK